MIFVSVGTQEKPFNRLIEGVDRIADIVSEGIVAQIGHSTYIPKKCEFFRFCGQKEMLAHIRNARIVISQAGFGIIGNSISLNKPMILVPRDIKYGEAVDKQYELAEYLASQSKSIVCVRDVKLIANAIEEIKNVQVQYDYRTTIPALIDNFISQAFFKGE